MEKENSNTNLENEYEKIAKIAENKCNNFASGV